MTRHVLQSKKLEDLTSPLGSTYWRTISTLDWRNPDKLYGQLDTTRSPAEIAELGRSLKAAKVIKVQAYCNVVGDLARGVFAADWAVRFLRIGTTNDTGLDHRPLCVPPAKAGTRARAHFATWQWEGANPGGMHAQVMHDPGFFDTFQADTRFIKVFWTT